MREYRARICSRVEAWRQRLEDGRGDGESDAGRSSALVSSQLECTPLSSDPAFWRKSLSVAISSVVSLRICQVLGSTLRDGEKEIGEMEGAILRVKGDEGWIFW